MSNKSTRWFRPCVQVLGVALGAMFACAGEARAGFTAPDWQNATLRIDTAELTARRNIGTVVLNELKLMGNPGGLRGMQEVDLSEALFGAIDAAPVITQGARQTGVREIDIPQFFWPSIEAGDLTLWALFTDTADATFALDFISIKIFYRGGTSFEKTFGSHATTKNDGFGLGIADGAMLPNPLPGALTATGTGFNETISSKSIHASWFIPSPGTAPLVLLGAAVAFSRRRSSRVSH